MEKSFGSFFPVGQMLSDACGVGDGECEKDEKKQKGGPRHK